MAKKPNAAGDTMAPEGSMELWERVCTTPKNVQRDVRDRGRTFTVIDAQWQIEQATRLWGSYGDEWGLFDLRFHLLDAGGVDRSGTPYQDKVAVLEATFRYPKMIDGLSTTVEFPIINDMRFVPGEDTFKKLVTNTRSKALSWLGFSADVFMRKFIEAPSPSQGSKGSASMVVEQAKLKISSASSKSDLNGYRDRIDEMVDQKALTLDEANELRELCDATEFGLG